MKIFINTIQVLLALWVITGASYMMGNYSNLANVRALEMLPSVFWILLGIIQIVFAVGLLAAVAKETFRKFATPSAIGLGVTSILGAFIYSAYAGFPGILWAIIPAVLFGVIAFKK